MIVITGATGRLGPLVVAELLARGVPAEEIVAAVRTPKKATDLAAQGVRVRQADYSQPDTLTSAFAGAEKLLLISSSANGQRIEQHRNVVSAAAVAGVRQIAYTSILRADTSALQLAGEHKATEELIRESGIPYVFLRNGWYLENYSENLAPAVQYGVINGSAGDGRIAAAARADFAAAAAAVLSTDGHHNAVYELAGDKPFTMSELAAEVTRQSGTQVAYRDLPAEEYTSVLINVGLPAPYAALLADSDEGIVKGELDTDSDDLLRLIDRPTTSLSDAVAVGLKALA